MLISMEFGEMPASGMLMNETSTTSVSFYIGAGIDIRKTNPFVPA